MQTSLTRLSLLMIALLSGASALGPAAMQILLPALPVIREDFGVSTGVAQLTLSLSMLSIAVATLVYGPVSDRFGRKPTLMIGSIITLVGSLACFIAPNVLLLILGRVVQAFGGAVGLVVARAIARDVYGPQESAKIISTLVMVMVVIPMLSPALGGELMFLFGWRSVFLIIAAFSLLILTTLYFRLPETLAEPAVFQGLSGMFRTFAVLMQSPVFRGYGFSVAFVSVVFFSFISAAPEIMVSVLHRPATEYGYYFVMIPAGFMAGNYVSRRYGNHLGTFRIIDIGSKISLAGISLTLALQWSGLRHPIFLFLPIAVAIFGGGLTLPNAQAGAINEFPRHAGTASGLTGFLQMGLSSIAAQLVAIIFNGTAYPLLLLMFTASLFSLLSFRLGVGRPVTRAD
ncbi:MAG: multidrug effflux MFS transporter [Gammaproteobacteria bacterium]|nr:multidrug effflux MFS transporter [Pseudomonadales bacterium]MCP5345491.1 multidrug effflux MFS transporter [Pseudomonadales bacterium]